MQWAILSLFLLCSS